MTYSEELNQIAAMQFENNVDGIGEPFPVGNRTAIAWRRSVGGESLKNCEIEFLREIVESKNLTIEFGEHGLTADDPEEYTVVAAIGAECMAFGPHITSWTTEALHRAGTE